MEHTLRAANMPRYSWRVVCGRPLCADEHGHDFYELVYLSAGAATHIVDGVPTRMEPGALCLLAPGMRHYFANQTDDLTLFSMSVWAEEIEPFLAAFGLPRAGAYALETAARAACEADWRRLAFESGDPRLPRHKALLSRLLAGFLLSDETEDMPVWLLRATEKMRTPEYVSGGVDTLCALAGISRAQLTRVMRAHTGQSPAAYVKRMRLRAAMELIRATDDDVESIARAVGYQSLSHFLKSFQAEFGTTPARIRRSRGTKTV